MPSMSRSLQGNFHAKIHRNLSNIHKVMTLCGVKGVKGVKGYRRVWYQ